MLIEEDMEQVEFASYDVRKPPFVPVGNINAVFGNEKDEIIKKSNESDYEDEA